MDKKPIKEGLRLFFPRVGRKAWIITDVYEELCAVPVTIIPREQSDLWELMEIVKGGKPPRYAVRWQICDGKQMVCCIRTMEYHEDYYLDSRRGLYRSEARARVALRRMKRKNDSYERWRRK